MSRPKEDRSQQIIERVLKNAAVTNDELAEEFGVSPTTIRRELRSLQAQGLVQRKHGGAVPIQHALYGPYLNNSSFAEQVSRMAVEKRRIGAAAARMVKENETIAIGPGTTTTELARHLDHRMPLRVFTNAVNVAMELSQRQQMAVIVSGGIMQGGWFSMAGHGAIKSAGDYTYDWLFIGATGIAMEDGVTDLHKEEAAVTRALMRRAKRTVLLADSSKFGVVSLVRVTPASALHLVVTDKRRGRTKELAALQSSGVMIDRV